MVKGVETGSLTCLLLVLGVEQVEEIGEAEVLGGNLESVTSSWSLPLSTFRLPDLSYRMP